MSLFRLFAEDEKNKDLTITNPVKSNVAVGNKNLTGMHHNRGIRANQLRIQELKEAGLRGQAQQLQIQSASSPVNWSSGFIPRASGYGRWSSADVVGKGMPSNPQIWSDANQLTILEGRGATDAAQTLKTTKGATDAAAAAKMFDGTKAGFAKGMNAIALGAAVIEKWGQRFAKEGWAGIGAGHKQEQLGRGLVEDEMVPF